MLYLYNHVDIAAVNHHAAELHYVASVDWLYELYVIHAQKYDVVFSHVALASDERQLKCKLHDVPTEHFPCE